MPRRLRRTVITGGVTYPAGTKETAALKEAITNPGAWEGESELSEDRSASEEPDVGPEPGQIGQVDIAALIESAVTRAVEPLLEALAQRDAEAAASAATRDDASASSESQEGGDAGGDRGTGEPPRSGKGSGEAAWRKYAEGLDIEVPEGASRDDIVALVDAR